jgi:cytochrome P450
LRIYGPAIGIQPREAIKTHTIGNITILKGKYKNLNIISGTTVSVGMAANSLNPKYFSDPLMFNPDRWVDGSILDE